MSYRTLPTSDAVWRPSNQMGVMNTDLAKQLDATTLGARLWRLAPGQASTRHRHRHTHELYLLLHGTGRIRIGDDLHTLEPLSSLQVEPDQVRQLFNDTDADQLWLVVGAPPEPANTLEMTDETLAWIYPDGQKALPPEGFATTPVNRESAVALRADSKFSPLRYAHRNSSKRRPERGQRRVANALVPLSPCCSAAMPVPFA